MLWILDFLWAWNPEEICLLLFSLQRHALEQGNHLKSICGLYPKVTAWTATCKRTWKPTEKTGARQPALVAQNTGTWHVMCEVYPVSLTQRREKKGYNEPWGSWLSFFQYSWYSLFMSFLFMNLPTHKNLLVTPKSIFVAFSQPSVGMSRAASWSCQTWLFLLEADQGHALLAYFSSPCRQLSFL